MRTGDSEGNVAFECACACVRARVRVLRELRELVGVGRLQINGIGRRLTVQVMLLWCRPKWAEGGEKNAQGYQCLIYSLVLGRGPGWYA